MAASRLPHQIDGQMLLRPCQQMQTAPSRKGTKMKRFLSVLCVAFLIAGAPAYAQQCFLGPRGVPVCYYGPNFNAPAVLPPTVQPYDPYFSPQNPFWLYYTPVCHYAPDVWGWRKECS
jgi:hypothetical protein